MSETTASDLVRADDPSGERAVCGAKKRDGTPCRQYPLTGTNRCRLHGGASPQAQAKARERILGAADLAAKRLIEFMNDKRVPWPVRLSAARDLLDRAGLNARNELTVELKPWEDAISRIVVDVPGELPELPSGREEWDRTEHEQYEAWDRPKPDTRDEPDPEEEPPSAALAPAAPVEPATFSSKPPARLDPDGLARKANRRGR